MEDATRSLLGLWDVTEALVEGIGAHDWSRPVAVPGTDVLDLAVHLTGVHYSGPDRVRHGLAAARALDAVRLADRPSGDRVLGATCLDMCLHAYDLGQALDAPIDLADHADAAMEACRLVAGVAPRLLLAATGSRDSGMRLRVRGPGGWELDRVLGQPRGSVTSSVEIEPAALLLVLSGRGDPDELRATGSARWSGDAADAFLRGARLFAAPRRPVTVAGT